MTVLNNASGQRREMEKNWDQLAGYSKMALIYMGFPCDKNNANG